MDIGLEAIAFDMPHSYIDMVELAKARGIDPDKFTIGLGQKEMAIATPCEDPVALGAEAGLRLLKNFDIDPSSISQLIVGTETGVDHSKTITSYIHEILGLPSACRVFEIKLACYGAMAGLAMANNYLMTGKAKGSKVLIISTDIARYGRMTVGEPTQGAGAVAMLLSDQPRLLKFDVQNDGYYSKHVMDFWRPLYSKEAHVDGHYSIQCYLEALEGAYSLYKKNALHSGVVDSLENFNARFAACLYHVPFVKMARKAHVKMLEVDQGRSFEKDTPEWLEANSDFEKRTAPYLSYNARIGNIYTGALFLSLINYLDSLSPQDAGKLVSLISYGSGCAAEFLSAEVAKDAVAQMKKNPSSKLFARRQKISIDYYEKVLDACSQMDQNDADVCKPENYTLDRRVVYLGTKNHKRVYAVDGKVLQDTIGG